MPEDQPTLPGIPSDALVPVPRAAPNPDVGRARRAERTAVKRRKTAADARTQAMTPGGSEAERRVAFDSYQNFAAQIGIGTNNQATAGGYGFNPITRNHIELEWLYRGSWIAQVAVDYLADDTMARGIEINSQLEPGAGDELLSAIRKDGSWDKMRQVHKWGRLYGGALGVIMIDGQLMSTPLRLDTIRPGQYKGLIVLDRWMVNPSLGELVEEAGDDFGMPKYYDVQVAIPGLGNQRIHHSRCLRIDGVELPYWQKVSENYWSMSVIEPLWDRLLAFDSTTLGASQLVYKAFIRIWKVKGLRQILGGNDVATQALAANVNWMRQIQTNEAISMVDAEDDFSAMTYSFAGLAETMGQFAQQLSGALGIPLVRLFGQSPSGFSSGDADLQNYDDNVAHHQESRVRRPLDKLFRVEARSKNIKLPDDFSWNFRPFRVLDEVKKAEVAERVTQTVVTARENGLISDKIAAKELSQQSGTTGIFTNLSDDFIDKLDADPPPVGEGQEPGEQVGGESGVPPLPEPRPPGLGMGEEDAAPARPTGKHVHFHVVDGVNRDLMLHGLPIYIETFRGQERRGLRGWSVKMPADYGYIRHTGSAEGPAEGLDCFLGENRDSEQVFVIDQVNPETGEFDEHKVMLGYPNRTLALRDYQRAFSDGSGAARVGGVKNLSMSQFKGWLTAADVTRRAV